MLSVEDWAEIRRLRRAEGLPIKMIARTLGISRNTVRAASVAGGPPRTAVDNSGTGSGYLRVAVPAELRSPPPVGRPPQG